MTITTGFLNPLTRARSSTDPENNTTVENSTPERPPAQRGIQTEENETQLAKKCLAEISLVSDYTLMPKVGISLKLLDPFCGISTLFLSKLKPHQILLYLSPICIKSTEPSMRSYLIANLEKFCNDYRDFFNDHLLIDLIPIDEIFSQSIYPKLGVIRERNLASHISDHLWRTIEEQCVAPLQDQTAVLKNLKNFMDIRYAKAPTYSSIPNVDHDEVKVAIKRSGINRGGVQYDYKLNAILPADQARTEKDWLDGLYRIFILSGLAQDYLFKDDLSSFNDLESIQLSTPKSILPGGVRFHQITNSAETVDDLIIEGREAGSQLLALCETIKGCNNNIHLYFGQNNSYLFKSRESIEEKLTIQRSFGYDNIYGIQHVEDAYRGTITVDNIYSMKQALKEFQASAGNFNFYFEMELMAYSMGFFGVNAKLVYQADSGETSIGELQFHFTPMISIENSIRSPKDLSHDIYEVTRLGAPYDLTARGSSATTLLCLSVMDRIE